MRLVPLLAIAALVTGCAGTPATPRTPERHAANIAAAESAGYKVVRYGDRAVFCPSTPPTGSHIGSMCLSESEWEAQMGATPLPSPTMHVVATPPAPGPGSGH